MGLQGRQVETTVLLGSPMATKCLVWRLASMMDLQGRLVETMIQSQRLEQMSLRLGTLVEMTDPKRPARKESFHQGTLVATMFRQGTSPVMKFPD